MPNALTRAFNSIGGSLMARSGRVGILGTTGAKTGPPAGPPSGSSCAPTGRSSSVPAAP